MKFFLWPLCNGFKNSVVAFVTANAMSVLCLMFDHQKNSIEMKLKHSLWTFFRTMITWFHQLTDMLQSRGFGNEDLGIPATMSTRFSEDSDEFYWCNRFSWLKYWIQIKINHSPGLEKSINKSQILKCIMRIKIFISLNLLFII